MLPTDLHSVIRHFVIKALQLKARLFNTSGQQNDKFFTTITGNEITPEMTKHQLCYRRQCAIPYVMTKGVIHLLKMVNVDDRNRVGFFSIVEPVSRPAP